MGDALRRKLAIASWRSPTEPNIYGKLTLDATEALAYIDAAREQTGERVTITHIVGRAVGAALAAEPTLNGTIRLGRYVPHDRVSVAFLVSMEDGSDLAKAKIEDVDRKSIVEISSELREHAERLRAGRDPDWERSKGLIRLLPSWLLRPVVWLTGLLTSSFGVDAGGLGLSSYPFGSAIVTSVGMLGLDEAYVPPTPFARVPLYVLVGAVRPRPTVVDGEVVVRPMLTVTATIDHRYVDGFQAGTIARVFRRVFEDPWSTEESTSGTEQAASTDGDGGRPRRVAIKRARVRSRSDAGA